MNKNSYLALGGLFAALHLLFVMLAKFLPGSELILVIFLPLLSTVYTLKFSKKEVSIFVLATFLLCAIFEPVATFIYVVPGFICGVTYGILSKRQTGELSLVYISSLAHLFSLLIAFIAISVLFKEVNFFQIFGKFIHKDGKEFYVSIFLVLLLIGLLEAFIVHIISNNELKRLGYKEARLEETTPKWMLVALFVFGIVYVALGFIEPVYSIYVYPFTLALCIPIVIEFILNNKRKWIYAFVGATTLLSIFALSYVDKIMWPGLLIVIVLPIIVEKFVRILYTIYLKYLNKGKNKIE